MKEFLAGTYDVAVIGAGHAGIEAALATARLGLETICFTINLDAVGNMPCNPAIGGTGKGHLVRELDALGGEMARAADKACIQYRMLNRGKGPVVHSLRAQADRRTYQQVMKHTLERQEHLVLRQAEVVDIRVTDGRVSHVVIHTGAVFEVLAPEVEIPGNEDDNSLVMMLDSPDGRILFTGDMEHMEELNLLSGNPDLHCDVLKVPNHADTDACSNELIAACAPKVAVISTDSREKSDTPASRILKELKKAGCETYITQDCTMGVHVVLHAGEIHAEMAVASAAPATCMSSP